MRAGGCTVQQALTAEAASVVKQAVALAKRRGHAQVTPLHVATTMLAASGGVLRTACLQSHSHPLQCKALELCFNVALNRLPASSASPTLGGPPHRSQQYPSISNALVAAFKRAQAHQRRGSIENQQQQLLAVKIELKQLIISILDDPSVSRVMKEAGFLSTQVKSNVEKVVSSESCFQNSPTLNKSKENNLLTLSPSPTTIYQTLEKIGKPSTSESVGNEDVNSIIEALVKRRKKSIVIVGESISSLESIVRGVMHRVDKGGVPESLREVKFISIPLHSFCNEHREVVEQKMGELACLVKSLVEKGVVLYLGDLKWITDYRANCWGQERSYYCPVEHMIMEIGKLVCGIGEIGKFWLMGIATFHTFTRCRSGQYSLENIWGLHPVTVPGNSLGLSLICHSDKETEATSQDAENGGLQPRLTDEEEKLNCCADCSAEFETEARNLRTNTHNTEPTFSSLPSWLRNESRRLNSNDQDCVSVGELCNKWNAICNSVHKKSKALERTPSFSSASPSPSSSCFSFDLLNPSLQQGPFSRQAFSSNPNSTPNPASSSNVMDTDYAQNFKEFNAQILKFVCSALEEKVPWQKEIIPDIAGSILQCRSGMLRRKDKVRSTEVKEETWLFFLGLDAQAKEKVAKELAKIVFGSYSNFVSIPLSRFSCTRSDSTDDYRNKRTRHEQNSSYIESFCQAVSSNPHRVFLVEDLDQADYFSQIGIKRAIEKGRITNENGEEFSLCDAIIILSSDSFSTRSRASSPSTKQKSDGSLQEEKEEKCPRVSLDLNIGFDDEKIEDNQSMDDLGILEIVDRRIVFQIQEL
ncbi:protein SMAX1-LIKE 3-like [Olea europaea var. sylvestris]|uniref:protein SMAX1-LIKE 3-like n=1 Tax=Olea europaea var. sylvestris TaxID=158386 RepID=UPI000C1D543C|nr:protein SMAX1-LIKE 3-like [Olea europaea var. sylvestris]